MIFHRKDAKTLAVRARLGRLAKEFVILPKQNRKSFSYLIEKVAKGFEKFANANFLEENLADLSVLCSWR